MECASLPADPPCSIYDCVMIEPRLLPWDVRVAVSCCRSDPGCSVATRLRDLADPTAPSTAASLSTLRKCTSSP